MGELITVSQLESQISAAQRFPRNVGKSFSEALQIATSDEEVAQSCLYSRPVGKDDHGKQIYAEGMSIRLAEIVFSCWGNIELGARIIGTDEKTVTAQGIARDLEKNITASSEVVESILTKYGKRYSESQIIVTQKAAMAKARRDAIFQIIPRALCKQILDACKNYSVGKVQDISRRRSSAIEWASKIGVSKERLFAAIGVNSGEEINSEHLITLTGLKTSIKDGEIDVEEAFPVLQNEEPSEKPRQQKPELTEAILDQTNKKWLDLIETGKASRKDYLYAMQSKYTVSHELEKLITGE